MSGPTSVCSGQPVGSDTETRGIPRRWRTLRHTTQVKLAPLLFAASVLALEPFAEHALLAMSSHRPALPCECAGATPSRVNVVYLHGRDTFAPSWTEIRNRYKLSAIAQLLRARIAFPRSRSSWLPQRSNTDPSVAHIRAAADTCFPRGAPFVVVGFSDGANAVNQLFLDCRSGVTSEYVSIGSSQADIRNSVPLAGCGHLVLIAGQHEAGLTATRLLARQLAKRGADVEFHEHPGPHELPFSETMSALRLSIR